MRRLLPFVILLVFCQEATARAAVLTTDFWAMPIYKKGPGRWETGNEPVDLTIEWSDGKMDAGRARRKGADMGSIAPTPVRGVFRRFVDSCVLHGSFSDGSILTMSLPREEVRFSRFERQGLKLKVIMVAVAINCPTIIKKADGEIWEGTTLIPDCEAHGVNRRLRLADPVSCTSELKKRK